MIKTCKYCGKEFKGRNKLYCSKECLLKDIKMPLKVCLICNKVFKGRRNTMYCSKECQHIGISLNAITNKNKRLHKIWLGMRSRCNNPNRNRYNNYGGRGIKICDEWDNYETFFIWSIENGYADNLTIDRIDVNCNYEPSNCRWITKKEQAKNKVNTLYFTYDNKTYTLKEWSEILNINYKLLWERIRKRGWTIEKAFTTK